MQVVGLSTERFEMVTGLVDGSRLFKNLTVKVQHLITAQNRRFHVLKRDFARLHLGKHVGDIPRRCLFFFQCLTHSRFVQLWRSCLAQESSSPEQ